MKLIPSILFSALFFSNAYSQANYILVNTSKDIYNLSSYQEISQNLDKYKTVDIGFTDGVILDIIYGRKITGHLSVEFGYGHLFSQTTEFTDTYINETNDQYPFAAYHNKNNYTGKLNQLNTSAVVSETFGNIGFYSQLGISFLWLEASTKRTSGMYKVTFENIYTNKIDIGYHADVGLSYNIYENISLAVELKVLTAIMTATKSKLHITGGETEIYEEFNLEEESSSYENLSNHFPFNRVALGLGFKYSF